MKKRKYLYLGIAIMAFVAFSFSLTIEANVTSEKPNNDTNAEKRADIITINTLKSFGSLDRKEVPFLHDAHTDTLEKTDKGCDACHLAEETSDNQILHYKFKRLEDESRQQVMDVYHTNCIACHKEMSDAGNKTGPVEKCGNCHKKEPETMSSWQPMNFDKSLHFLHIEINDEDCGVCHHGSEKEDSCRNCHRPESRKKLTSMKDASHLLCINCHSNLSGPVKCNECHDINELQKIEKLEDIPRLMRDQPDVVLMGSKSLNKTSPEMNPVQFDHKAHEESQESCRVCHHEGIDSCTKSCHTTTGSKNGKMVSAEQAMHQLDSKKSCIGCHERNKGQAECAGCHGFMEQGSNNDDTCLKCHMEPLKADANKTLTPELMATMLLETRKTGPDTFDDKDIPETVIIKELSNQYGSVELPHRQIINALASDIKNSKLASYFHNNKETLCQACHHNSPASNTPPRCSSCHNKPFDDSNPLKPGLKAAFHQQCMDCHDRMGISEPKSTGCVDCHKVIGVNKLYDF